MSDAVTSPVTSPITSPITLRAGCVTCTPAEAAARAGAGTAQLIDVRTPAEFRFVHAVDAQLYPLGQFDPKAVAAALPAGASIYLLCRTGGRAAQAAQQFASIGQGCVVVEGGTEAWVAAGLPVERGRAAMSLERQVRIAAGMLVVIGVVLGFFVHRAWFGLSGFVGAGLTFAGITDTCMMGMMIARMPWNR